MSATPGTAAGGATPATVSDAESSDMAVTKIANTQKDTKAATATDILPPPVSHPTDPNVPSLVTLPGEVRNAIYEALFIREDPIQIHANSFDPLGYHSGSVVLGTALLQSCRQIQYEATGIFYARNVFQLVLPLSTDDEDGLVWAMDWLRIIGKQSSFLCVIQLDIHNLLEADGDLEILPILAYTWKLEHKDMAVSFVTSPERLIVGFQGNRPWSANHTAKINKGLSTLIADPSNLLRKYCIASMLLRVKLDTDGSEVLISYRHNHRGGGDWMTQGRISISDEGQARMISRNRNPGFCDLMTIHGVRKKLFDSIQPPGLESVFDLTNQTTNLNLKSLAGANRLLRREIMLEVGDYDSIFNSTTSTRKYNFATELERFEAIQLHGHPRYFHLYFDLSEQFTLEDIRFDALPFISSLSWLNHDVHLKIEVRHPIDSETPNRTVTLLLRELQVSVFCFLYNLLETYPKNIYLPRPNVWTNGLGKVKEVTWQDELGLEPLDTSYLDNSHGVMQRISSGVANDWASIEISRILPGIQDTLLEFLGEKHGW
ncbi:uncharacterized protein J4E78_001638 [Alternaria triticimaculans]|uniref:uncharacterized protein n=1 Tax=Alternaria triticimaculans TaxID=297637 RepID=UPI0020C4234C|nr:uncharacterized protein J4E78_001638 [Alternaria triticimaculans]KAI4673131.1 hypothetical protein J4E78_001638 [Alternaria triticimaculans]